MVELIRLPRNCTAVSVIKCSPTTTKIRLKYNLGPKVRLDACIILESEETFSSYICLLSTVIYRTINRTFV